MLIRWNLYLVSLIGILMVSTIRAQQMNGVSNLYDTIPSVEIINGNISTIRATSNEGQYVIVKFYNYLFIF